MTTLVVVAALFFLASLVVAYSNRNLIFEQRTATNQARSTQAFEIAEAGLEWSLAMLNTGRVTADTCEPTADATSSNFRQRYLDIGPGNIVVRNVMSETASNPSLPTCVQTTTGLSCTCPASGSATPTAPSGTSVAPAFRMRFVQRPGSARPGTVWVQVNGCTRMEASCLDFPSASFIPGATDGDARVRVEAMIALKPALPAVPVAAVTVRSALEVEGVLTAANPTRTGGSIAVITGASITGSANISATGPAGTPPDPAQFVRSNDPSLGTDTVPTGERFFSGLYAAAATDYRDQPGAIRIDCSAATCDADRLRALAVRNPGRVLWARGDVSLDGGASLGTADEPVLLVVEGDFAATDITIHGVVHGRAQTWEVSGTGATLHGALVAENSLRVGAANNLTVIHDASVLERLRTRTGSFVRVPGGWRDF